MENDIRNSRLYKKLRVSQTGPVIAVIIAFVFIAAIEFFAICAAVSEQNASGNGIGLGIVSTLIVAVLAVIAVVSCRKTKRINAQKMKRLNSLSFYEMTALEEQIENSELLYKTFCLAEEYLYVPKCKLLIKYVDIQDFQTIVHSTNGIKDGVKVKITDNDGVEYQITVRKWKQYLAEFESFVGILNDKKRMCTANMSEKKLK